MLFKKIFYISSFFVLAVLINLSLSNRVFAEEATTTAITTTATSTATTTFANDATLFTTVATTTATSTPVATTTVPTPPSFNPLSAVDVEKMVRSYFADVPIMFPIAKCESGFRQFRSDGRVLYGGTGSMIGIFQISSGHTSKATSLGFDIQTIDGNLGYARYLYNKQSTDPWISSIDCWNPNNSVSTNGSIDPQNKNLSFGMTDSGVLTLQQMLNRTGFPVSSTGAGSPGNETTMFGSLTRAALRSFQCAKNIACSGNEYTTGYGLYDQRTRAALVSASASAPVVQQTVTQAPVTPSAISNDDSPQIVAMKAQLVQLIALVAELQKQLAALR